MLILNVEFLKLMKETFENNLAINFENIHWFWKLGLKKRIFSYVHMCGHHCKYDFSIFNLFFSVLRIGQGDNDCHIPVFFPCCLSVSGDLAAKSGQMSYRKSGQTVG